MTIRLTPAIACVVLVLVSFEPLAQLAAPSPERGQRLYMEKMCFTCHGTVGQGGTRGSGPRIAPGKSPFDAFAQQVRHPRQSMPRYPAKFLSDPELMDIHAYLAAIKPWRAVSDIELLRSAP